MSCDGFSELTMFLVIKKQFVHVFEEKWSEFKHEYDDAKTKSGEAKIDNVTAASVSTAGAKIDAAGGAGKEPAAKRRRVDGKPDDGGAKQESAGSAPKGKQTKKTEPKDTDSPSLLKQALQVKAQYNKHKVAGETLVNTIIAGAAGWTFAKNPENVGALQQALENLQKHVTGFARDFLLLSTKQIDDKSGSQVNSELATFSNLQEYITTVHNKTKTLLKRFAAGSD
jgi:hypothetical protein